MQEAGRRITWLRLGFALLLLNLGLTFQNLWPTPWVTTHHKVSIEIALLLLALTLYAELRRPPSLRLVGWLAAGLTLLALGRYAQVTAPALYGRPVNLYWDAQHLPGVLAMLAQVTPAWLVILGAAGLALLIGALYLAQRWALGSIWTGLAHTTARRTVGALTAAVTLLYLAAPALHLHTERWFSRPVTTVFVRQANFLWAALSKDGHTQLPNCQALPASDLGHVAGADVLLVFVESYGAVSYDQPGFNDALEASRERLASAIQRTGREAVSAFVESPTFGGSSWLAHSSLLAGVEVRDPQTYQLLLTRDCDTLPDRFARHGYRSLALMPGLRHAWPEGSFYGFERIYDERSLDYQGPDFGWWRIPDQYAIARLDQLEMTPGPRRPLFVFYPTISSHMPFRPTPPYQSNWERLLTQNPFESEIIEASLTRSPDWINLGPAYTDVLAYTFTWLAGYLENHAAGDLVMIVIGDHQPPAGVSGIDAPWAVPVHVITHRPAILGPLKAVGLQPGLTPGRPALGRMHELTALLLDAFDSPSPLTPSPRASSRSASAELQPGVDVP
ncbi:MAG: hypothetical protein PVI28_12880 [Gammaproteobacteria bacterium]|jgi:hypothetical protein